MGWPNMEFSTPTTASHALVSAEAEEEIQRQFKRRKLVSEDASMAVDDPVTAPSSTAAASVFSNPTSTASQTAATTGMEVDPTPSVSSSTSTLSCSTQAQQQQQQQQQQRHNGNSWTDEELVYQVHGHCPYYFGDEDVLSSCPPSDVVL